MPTKEGIIITYSLTPTSQLPMLSTQVPPHPYHIAFPTRDSIYLTVFPPLHRSIKITGCPGSTLPQWRPHIARGKPAHQQLQPSHRTSSCYSTSLTHPHTMTVLITKIICVYQCTCSYFLLFSFLNKKQRQFKCVCVCVCVCRGVGREGGGGRDERESVCVCVCVCVCMCKCACMHTCEHACVPTVFEYILLSSVSILFYSLVSYKW